jgi:hypothetical protein
MDILSYCAGIFDADGCFTMYEYTSKGSAKYPYMKGQAVVEIREEKIVDLFMTTFGGIKQVKQPKNPSHSKTFIWKATGPTLDYYIKIIEPYLLLKVEQARLIVQMRQVRCGKTSSPITADEYTRLGVFKQKMRELNKNGVGKQ